MSKISNILFILSFSFFLFLNILFCSQHSKRDKRAIHTQIPLKTAPSIEKILPDAIELKILLPKNEEQFIEQDLRWQLKHSQSTQLFSGKSKFKKINNNNHVMFLKIPIDSFNGKKNQNKIVGFHILLTSNNIERQLSWEGLLQVPEIHSLEWDIQNPETEQNMIVIPLKATLKNPNKNKLFIEKHSFPIELNSIQLGKMIIPELALNKEEEKVISHYFYLTSDEYPFMLQSITNGDLIEVTITGTKKYSYQIELEDKFKSKFTQPFFESL